MPPAYRTSCPRCAGIVRCPLAIQGRSWSVDIRAGPEQAGDAVTAIQTGAVFGGPKSGWTNPAGLPVVEARISPSFRNRAWPTRFARRFRPIPAAPDLARRRQTSTKAYRYCGMSGRRSTLVTQQRDDRPIERPGLRRAEARCEPQHASAPAAKCNREARKEAAALKPPGSAHHNASFRVHRASFPSTSTHTAAFLDPRRVNELSDGAAQLVLAGADVNCQPCQGHVTILPMRHPLPNGPPWCGHTPSSA